MADKYVKLDDVIDTLEQEWGYEGMREDLYNLPTADVVEVKHGEWKHECLECSVCKRNISEIYDADSYMSYGIEDDLRYCPYCGAKMDGGKVE